MYQQVLKDEGKYWEIVSDTLREVFQASNDRMDDLRATVQRLPEEDRVLFYHAEPLDVAADLAGVTEILPNQLEIYDRILRDFQWAP